MVSQSNHEQLRARVEGLRVSGLVTNPGERHEIRARWHGPSLACAGGHNMDKGPRRAGSLTHTEQARRPRCFPPATRYRS
jgi:hypothetical protein